MYFPPESAAYPVATGFLTYLESYVDVSQFDHKLEHIFTQFTHLFVFVRIFYVLYYDLTVALNREINGVHQSMNTTR